MARIRYLLGTILKHYSIGWLRKAERAIAEARSRPSQDLDGGRVPGLPAYELHKTQLITKSLFNGLLLARFRNHDPLTLGYGAGVDERCVEYPWLFAQLSDEPGTLLDAGSSLNHEYILCHPLLQRKVIHILTLAPEPNCFWRRTVSYLFSDLRDIPIRDGYYDTIVCLSTLEHIGCDNSVYTQKETHREDRPEDFVRVMQELRRVLKAEGSLLLTVPFGRYRHFGEFQQFDHALLSRAINAFGRTREVSSTFYRYTADGWNIATLQECADCEYVGWGLHPPRDPALLTVKQPDGAAAARAVACVRIVKA